MTIKRYLVETTTAWCGEDLQYKALTDDKHMYILEGLVALRSYENFCDFDGPETVRSEMFPDSDGDWTDEQIDEAASAEPEYYYYSIDEFDGTEEEWGWYELIYDCSAE